MLHPRGDLVRGGSVGLEGEVEGGDREKPDGEKEVEYLVGHGGMKAASSLGNGLVDCCSEEVLGWIAGADG